MAGLTVTGADINNVSGDICRAVDYQLRRATNLKLFLDKFTAQDLVDQFGLTIGDANLIKSAVNQLATIEVTFQANRTFINQVEGLGDI